MTTSPPPQKFENRDALDPRMALAFPTLSATDLKALKKFGTPKHVAKGKAVWEAGQANMCMFVVLREKWTSSMDEQIVRSPRIAPANSRATSMFSAVAPPSQRRCQNRAESAGDRSGLRAQNRR